MARALLITSSRMGPPSFSFPIGGVFQAINPMVSKRSFSLPARLAASRASLTRISISSRRWAKNRVVAKAIAQRRVFRCVETLLLLQHLPVIVNRFVKTAQRHIGGAALRIESSLCFSLALLGQLILPNSEAVSLLNFCIGKARWHCHRHESKFDGGGNSRPRSSEWRAVRRTGMLSRSAASMSLVVPVQTSFVV